LPKKQLRDITLLIHRVEKYLELKNCKSVVSINGVGRGSHTYLILKQFLLSSMQQGQKDLMYLSDIPKELIINLAD